MLLYIPPCCRSAKGSDTFSLYPIRLPRRIRDSRKAEYHQILSHRMQPTTEALNEVKKLRKAVVYRKKILIYIWDSTDSEPCMVDVHNLLAKLKSEMDPGTSLIGFRKR
ncbi:hypothetical protein L917_12694 [Phytophthora nicotianae]|uniref:Uncharacterized protein n=1 Tax=Phytophthora nicotianae TaxID=4792 RepID=W2KSN8_PHYNI|nr:hypothetical protein L917_12694 [Phytophthora nicotianae]